MVSVKKALLGLLISSVVVCAQSERGAITGEVRDSSGAVVQGARIVITNSLTGVRLEAETNDRGEYTVTSLQPNTYDVRAEKKGFRPTEERGLPVAASSTVRADLKLEVGSSTQVVEVAASAVQLQTEDAKNSTSVQNKLVDDLPLVVNGTVRTPFDLASLTPDAKNLGGDNGFSVGGGQVAAYGTSLDGVSTNTSRALSKSWVASNSPSVEAIDQFTVDTNGYKAEYGHAGGGNLTYVSKSGTNQYHGSAYEFIRNNDFDANNWFSNRSGIANSIYKQNDFGVTAGGPVWIPKIYHGKDKTFFFFSYEGFRNRAGANGTAFTIPTPEMYNGDFSKWVTSSGTADSDLQSDNAGHQCERQRDPHSLRRQSDAESLFSPASMKALSVFQSSGTLTPNTGAAPGTVGYVANNYLETSGTHIYPVNKWSVKGDHIFNEKQRISGYFGDDHEHQTYGPDGPPTLPGLYTNYNDLLQWSYVIRISWDWNFGPNKINHFYAGGNDWNQDHKPPQEYIGNWQSKFCLGNVPNCNAEPGQPVLNGGTATPTALGAARRTTALKIPSTPTTTTSPGFTGSTPSSSAACTSSITTTVSAASAKRVASGSAIRKPVFRCGTNPNAGGNAFASFLLGYADSGQIDTLRFIGQQFYYFGGFFQDDWRVTPKLVLELGVRWDGNLPPTGLNNRWTDFGPTTPNPAAGGIPGAVLVCRQLHRLRGQPRHWPTSGTKAMVRTSASLIRKTRRP